MVVTIVVFYTEFKIRVSFEDELSRLKEVTTILELALWKIKRIDHSLKDSEENQY
jgi:hypothetical protein